MIHIICYYCCVIYCCFVLFFVLWFCLFVVVVFLGGERVCFFLLCISIYFINKFYFSIIECMFVCVLVFYMAQ